MWGGWTCRMMSVWALWCLTVQQNWRLMSRYECKSTLTLCNHKSFSLKISHQLILHLLWPNLAPVAVGCLLRLFALHWILWQQKCVGVTLTLRIFRLWKACLVMQLQKPIWWSHYDPCARCHLFVCLQQNKPRGIVTDTLSKGTPARTIAVV